ncbi:DUF397 domain-containing protein [Streptomyces sp. NPDC086777]|uniref:DUF397 domain-containing protein n=1 Tax=Streptomyces sp. NPDC086777 TaxID=3154866 RepID=UPI00344F234D
MRNIPDHVLSTAVWIKSSYSGGGGDNCLEVTAAHPTLIPVRDSKTAPHGPALTFLPETWSAFVEGVKSRGRGPEGAAPGPGRGR